MKCSIFDKEFDPYDCIGDITSYDDDSKAERYAEFKHNANCEQEDTSIEDNAAPYFLKKMSEMAICKYISNDKTLSYEILKELDNTNEFIKYIQEESICLDLILSQLEEKGIIKFTEIDKNTHYNLKASYTQLMILYNGLVDEKFIDQETDFNLFRYALTGTPTPKQFKEINWIRNKNMCAALIYTLNPGVSKIAHIGEKIFGIKHLAQLRSNLLNNSRGLGSDMEKIKMIIKQAGFDPQTK